jgi:UMP-CMP kinase
MSRSLQKVQFTTSHHPILIHYFDTHYTAIYIGAGKGTQCELLIKNYPCYHLSAGQLLRDEAKKKDGSSEHAELIEECLVAGKIVPVEISLSLLRNAMREAEGNDSLIFLIDGFPRNFDNLEGWTRCMTRNGNNDGENTDAAAVWGVLSYDCPLQVLEERVMQRSKDSGRSDDNLESLRRRFKTFQGETVPVVDTLRAIDEKTSSSLRVVDIEGQRSLDEVWEETQHSMNSFVANDILSANMRLLEAIANKDVNTYRTLCADEMFQNTEDGSNQDNLTIMEAQESEGDNQFNDINVNDAQIAFITGKKVSVSYERTSDSGVTFRETRVWSHQGSKGWRQVHFYRTE